MARTDIFFLAPQCATNAFATSMSAVVGNAQSRKPLSELRDLFYDSPIPYSVDVVDFDAADAEFKTFVFQNEPIVWIQ